MVPVLALVLACAPKQAPEPAATPTDPVPPVAAEKPHTHTEHGVERADPYYWLRHKEGPEVIAYVEAENAYTEAMDAHAAPFRQALFDEMLARIQEDDADVPWADGDHLYYARTEAGKNYEIWCRKPIADGAAAVEQVKLDENVRAQGLDYYDLGAWEVSPDGRLLAVAEDTDGDEIYTIRFLDLASGELLDDVLEHTTATLTWANDSATLFYTSLDDALRPDALWRHSLGVPQQGDVLIHREADERFWTTVWRTRSDGYLVHGLFSSITSELRVLDADTPDRPFRTLTPRHQGMAYTLAHRGEHFYLRTNDCDDEAGEHTDCALNYKVVRTPVDGTDRSTWEEVIPHRDDVTLEGLDTFAGHLVVHERAGGVVQLRVRDLASGEDHLVAMPEDAYEIWDEPNAVFEATDLRFGYSSMITPESTFAWDMATQERTLLEEKAVLGGYDKAAYTTARLWATAPDGVQVPVTVVHRADLALDGTAPLILTGYGAYGEPYDPYFTVTRLPLLDRGVVFAIAHIRGGGDMGRGWYEDGKYLQKQNTFTDFIACTELLVAEGYAHPDRVATYGGSAGGLLMGAVLNQRPDLWAGVVAQVPFVDVVTTMLDEDIPLTAIEWEEWGNPDDEVYFDYMLAYSPYDNVTAQDYPPLLITSGLNDPRVQYWEPTKWAARLRATKTDDNVLLLKTNMGAGHAGASGRYGYLEDKAYEWAFLLESVGITE